MTDTEKNNAHSANVGNHTNKNSMCKYNIPQRQRILSISTIHNSRYKLHRHFKTV